MFRDDLLDALRADLVNERRHLATYLYLASAITGPHAAEYREFFEGAAKQELQHVLAFQDRIWGLGDVVPSFEIPLSPRRPGNMTVPGALLAAIELEREVVENYARRLAALDEPHVMTAARVGAPTLSEGERAYMKVFYEEQLQDSYEDLEKMQRLYKEQPL